MKLFIAIFGYHFSRTLWFSLACLGLFAFLTFKVMVHETPADQAEYSRLMAEANPGLLKKSTLTPYTASQQRNGIRKDYFYAHGSERLHMRLNSANATLMMHQQLEGSAFVEKMQNVQCYMQEELYYQLADGREALKQTDGLLALRHSKNGQSQKLSDAEVSTAMPMQQIRYFEAEEASYHYKDDKFYADNVHIVRFVLPGHLLPETLASTSSQMRGSANSIVFSLTGGELNFKAYGFKAQFNTEGKQL